MFTLTPYYGYDRRRAPARDAWSALMPFENDGFSGRPFGSDALANAGGGRMPSSIKVDLSETENEVNVAADIPEDFTKDDIKLDVHNNVLTITAETSSSGQDKDDGDEGAADEKMDEGAENPDEEGVTHHLRERSKARRSWATLRKVSRSIRLPTTVDAGKASASFEDNALHIRMPKVHPVNSITIS